VGLDSGNHCSRRENNEMCGKGGRFRKLATETENKVNFNRDFSRRVRHTRSGSLYPRQKML